VGLAVISGIAQAYDLDEAMLYQTGLRLKWPNDVLLNNAKLGGILIEGGQVKTGDPTWMIIGIGMNLRNAKQIESSLGSKSALKVATLDQFLPAQSTPPDMEYLWLKLIASLEHHLSEFDQHGFEIYQEQWKTWDAYLGQTVCVSGAGKEPIYGITQGIDQAGALLLQQNNQMIAIYAGDVSLRVQT
jgi:BirA family biotin operon repressor/biotin-[acetyl-CoA-carboxylase] ligase